MKSISKSGITEEEYAEGVVKLLHLARGDTGGSLAAAQVLLSAYNGNDWQLDITDLCSLDPDYYAAALAVIRGRTEIRTEPYLLIKDGDRLFRQLWEQWSRYHIDNRWKRQCPECSGAGKVYVDEISDEQVTCYSCEGEGFLAQGESQCGKLSGWRRGIRPHGPTSADEWADLYTHVQAWADRLRGVYLENTEASSIIQRWDSPETLFYVDPPYTADTRTQGLRGYAHEMTDGEHRDLANLLQKVQGHVVISGYASTLYDKELFANWHRVERRTIADKGKRSIEVLWISPSCQDVDLPLFAASRAS